MFHLVWWSLYTLRYNGEIKIMSVTRDYVGTYRILTLTTNVHSYDTQRNSDCEFMFIFLS